MSSIPPQINTSQPNTPADTTAANSAQNSTGFFYSNTKNPYKNYNIQNMYFEQTGKLLNPLLRFSLSCNGFNFQAHIDPTHLIDEQGKRLVQIDTLTGIVLQDFGYTVQNIELRGTTGARYYTEIKQMDDVFNNQSTDGNPTAATLTIEGRTYTGVWKDFSFERMAQENIYKYVIGFVVMKRGSDTANSLSNFSSTLTQSGILKNSISSSDGKDMVEYIYYEGKTPTDYVNTITAQVPIPYRSDALAYIAQHWSDATDNNLRSYPGDRGVLLYNEVLVVPTNWPTILYGGRVY